MTKTADETSDFVRVQKIGNSQLTTLPGHSRMIIPGMPSLPLRDNNNAALSVIAASLGGKVDFVSDVE
ncbi:hypothetical protein HGA34_04485 [Candidatus Falkowbacteria bacterium]|nr:hypothetical protein [Candidatus Falkowbacteria bacterium]